MAIHIDPLAFVDSVFPSKRCRQNRATQAFRDGSLHFISNTYNWLLLFHRISNAR